MPFAIIIIGLLMIVTGSRGTYAQFGSLVASEFQGQNNFIYWFLAIISVGAIGYIDSLRVISRLLLALVLISIIFSHKGFFAQFQQALKTGPKQPDAVGSSSQGSAVGNAVSNAATGNNPGSSLIGSITSGITGWFSGSTTGATQ